MDWKWYLDSSFIRKKYKKCTKIVKYENVILFEKGDTRYLSIKESHACGFLQESQARYSTILRVSKGVFSGLRLEIENHVISQCSQSRASTICQFFANSSTLNSALGNPEAARNTKRQIYTRIKRLREDIERKCSYHFRNKDIDCRPRYLYKLFLSYFPVWKNLISSRHEAAFMCFAFEFQRDPT